MKQIFKITLLVVVIVLSACRCNPEKVKKSIVVVLCDTSVSATLKDSDKSHQERKDKLKLIVRKIPKLYLNGSKIYYYPISNNTLSGIIGKEISFCAQKVSQVRGDSIKVSLLLDTICSELDLFTHKKPDSDYSCILTSIERANFALVDLAKTYTSENYDYNLVIISDMLEDCKRSNKEQITMRLKGKLALKFSEEIEKLKIEMIKIDNHLDLKIRVIVNSPGAANYDVNMIKNTWEDLFCRSGIRRDRINITEGIPLTR